MKSRKMGKMCRYIDCEKDTFLRQESWNKRQRVAFRGLAWEWARGGTQIFATLRMPDNGHGSAQRIDVGVTNKC